MFECMKIRSFIFYQLILSVITFFGSLIIFGDAFFDNDFLFTLILSYSIMGIFPLIWFHLQLKKQDLNFNTIIHTKNAGHFIPSILGLTITLFFFSLGAFWLTCYVFSFIHPGYVEFLLEEEQIFPDKGFMFFFIAIYISIIGPIAEELIFRGLLLKRLAKKINILFAIIATNIIFAVFHSDIIGAFMFGLILSIVYLKSNNLLLPIIMHIINNSLVTLLVIFEPPIPDFLNYETIEQVPGVMIPNLIILILTVPILISYIKKNVSLLKTRN